MENSNQNIIEKLNHLIAIAEDGKEGYENAAKDVEDSAIKSSFLLFSEERSHYATQLREIVHELNGKAEDNGGGSVGSLHRIWMDLKSTFTSGDKDAIINACITGEDAAVKEYKLVLNDSTIPESCKPLIEEQLNGIEKALANITSHINK
jgi:uncharacterized protein (TIGR02284 family)